MTTENNPPDHKPLKPWRSFDDQLALFRARGLLVDDEAAARDYPALLCDEFPREIDTAFSLEDFDLVEGCQGSTLWQLSGNRSGDQK